MPRFFQGTKVKLTLYFFSMRAKKKNARKNGYNKESRRPVMAGGSEGLDGLVSVLLF